MSDINFNNTDEAVETAAESFKKVEAGVSELFEGVDMAVPEAVRAIAEQTVTQSREAYETAKDTMEEAVEVLEKSIDQAGEGAAAFNRKVIDNAQTNLNTGFDLAKDLASAKNIAEIIELQASYARKQFEALTAQAEDIRTLS
ncbi:MAG: phasin family protein, partial [Hyphomicrobiaceae bacterium]|nr:phasin family protein [Hyphomicrobiaceae bacterium]